MAARKRNSGSFAVLHPRKVKMEINRKQHLKIIEEVVLIFGIFLMLHRLVIGIMGKVKIHKKRFSD